LRPLPVAAGAAAGAAPVACKHDRARGGRVRGKEGGARPQVALWSTHTLDAVHAAQLRAWAAAVSVQMHRDLSAR
jgi:hypothetical protein